jgi:hypothetical protein
MLVLAQRIGWWTSARIPSNPELPTRGHTRQKKKQKILWDVKVSAYVEPR